MCRNIKLAICVFFLVLACFLVGCSKEYPNAVIIYDIGGSAGYFPIGDAVASGVAVKTRGDVANITITRDKGKDIDVTHILVKKGGEVDEAENGQEISGMVPATKEEMEKGQFNP